MKLVLVATLIAIILFAGGYIGILNRKILPSISPTPSEAKVESLEEMSKYVVDRLNKPR